MSLRTFALPLPKGDASVPTHRPFNGTKGDFTSAFPTKGDASVPTHHPNSPRPYSSFALWPPFMDEGDAIWPGGASVPNNTRQSMYCN